MEVMATLLIAILNVYVLVMLARAILSWFRIGPDSPLRPVMDLLYRVTEPVLSPIRSVLPSLGGFDLSFLVVIFGINFVLIPLIATALP